MRMNSTNYKQYDTRWSALPYPTKRWNIGNSGCGEVTICNLIIEMNKWLNQTPKTIQPYCVQYAAPNGDGTYWSGIPAMLKHYGFTEVKEHDTMQQLFKELAKGNRVAVYLMGSASAGTKHVHWTSGGHFVGSVLYQKRGSEDWVYMKDPNSTSSLRNGWVSYNGNIRGACLKVWSGKFDGTPTPMPTPKQGKYTGQYPAPKTYLERGDKGTSVKYLQQYLNWSYGGQKGFTKLAEDGIFGDATDYWTRLWQEQTMGAGQGDGLVGSKTIAKMKEFGGTPAPSVTDKLLSACKTQANWMKNASYGAWKPVTIAHSKVGGTCVTYVGCVLQRIGYLKSGEYIWHTGKGYGTGKVYGTNSKMTTTYMNNKTFKALKSKLKAGDIVLCDDNKSGTSGNGGHIMVFEGKWSKKGNPYVWDVGKAMHCERTGTHREYDGDHKILAIVRLKG